MSSPPPLLDFGEFVSFSDDPPPIFGEIYEALGSDAQDDINTNAVRQEQQTLARQNQQIINRTKRDTITPKDRATLRRRYGRYLGLEFSRILGEYYKKPENAEAFGQIKANMIAIDEGPRSEIVPYLGLRVKIMKQYTNLTRGDFVPAIAGNFHSERKEDLEEVLGDKINSRKMRSLAGAENKRRGGVKGESRGGKGRVASDIGSGLRKQSKLRRKGIRKRANASRKRLERRALADLPF